jgi:opacity protein-like surface antigen
MQSFSRTLSATLLALAALTTATVTQAQSSNYSLYAPGASYIGLNAGKSDFSLGSGIGNFTADKRDTVYSIYAGSYFNPNLGLELGYTNLGKINRAGGNTKAAGANLSLVGKVPVGSSFNLMGKLGTTYSRTDVSAAPASGIVSGNESGFGVSYGLGAEYTFNPNWSAVLQYDAYDLKFPGSGRDRVSAATAGLRYRF